MRKPKERKWQVYLKGDQFVVGYEYRPWYGGRRHRFLSMADVGGDYSMRHKVKFFLTFDDASAEACYRTEVDHIALGMWQRENTIPIPVDREGLELRGQLARRGDTKGS